MIMGKVKTIELMGKVKTIGALAIKGPLGIYKSFHATGFTSAGAGASTIGIEVSNDGVNFVEVDELSLTLSTTIIAVSQDTFTLNEAWRYVRGNVKTISGTDAQVTLTMGTQL